ncbi:hypothetical protein [Roseivirga sp.]|uniref:hypothetical protein n=1 Tax=Roseivirga sp. TaxID=1964215 RepID=UPI002B27111F|nr:hypothetical protein [Roseivirga sp.]
MFELQESDFESIKETFTSNGALETRIVQFLKLSSLRYYLSMRQNNIQILFPDNASPKEYRLRGLLSNQNCQANRALSPEERANNREWIEIGNKTVHIELRGNTLKFPDKFFGFNISSGSLTIDLGGGIIDCGMQVARALDWCNLEEPNAKLKLDDTSFFKKGDNICCSFSGTNSSHETNFCYLQNDPTDENILSDFIFKKSDTKDTGSPIIPPNAYVSNGCLWGGETPTFKGTGEIRIENGFVQNGFHYFSFINSKMTELLKVSLNTLHFSGQFLDGLMVGPENTNQQPVGNVGVNITSCYFGESYDIAKQGISWNSIGDLEIDNCHFFRGNHDPDIYQDITIDSTSYEPGNIKISNSVFDGQKRSFLDYEHNPNPYNTSNDEKVLRLISKFESEGSFRFMYLNCLSVLQVRFVKDIIITNCLFENYERQLILTQLTQIPFRIDSIEVNDIIYHSGTPIAVIFLLPGLGQSKLRIKKEGTEDEEALRNQDGTLKYLDDLEQCHLGSVNFTNSVFDDVGQWAWAGLLDYASELAQTHNVVTKINERKEVFSNHISFNSCTFVKRREDTHIPNQTIGNQIFIDTTIINYTKDTLYFGIPKSNIPPKPKGQIRPISSFRQADEPYSDLSIAGYLRILRGKVIIRESRNRSRPVLQVIYFNQGQFAIFEPPSWNQPDYNETKITPWNFWQLLGIIRFLRTRDYQYDSIPLNSHNRSVEIFLMNKRNQTSQLEAFFNTL